MFKQAGREKLVANLPEVPNLREVLPLIEKSCATLLCCPAYQE
jgi:hypothetical protein